MLDVALPITMSFTFDWVVMITLHDHIPTDLDQVWQLFWSPCILLIVLLFSLRSEHSAKWFHIKSENDRIHVQPGKSFYWPCVLYSANTGMWHIYDWDFLIIETTIFCFGASHLGHTIGFMVHHSFLVILWKHIINKHSHLVLKLSGDDVLIWE